jgi:uncharacterized protein (TIRG00374 family)
MWLLFAAILAAALVPLLLGGGDLLTQLQAFPPGLLLAMFGMVVLGWNLNALRLRLLLGNAQVRHRRALGIVVATEFAICATPAGAGGPLTLMALLMRQGIPPTRGTALYALEQLSDLVVFCCALVGIFIFALSHTLNPYLSGLLGGTAALLGGSLLVLALLGRYHRPLLRGSGSLLLRLGLSPERKRRWLRKFLGFRNALRDSLRLPWRVLGAVLLLTILHWLLRYSILWLALLGLAHAVPWGWTVLIQMLALSAGQLSLLPGGAGSAELASVALLKPLVGTSTAAVAILIWRAVTFHFYLIVGTPVFLHLAGRPLLQRLVRSRQS